MVNGSRDLAKKTKVKVIITAAISILADDADVSRTTCEEIDKERLHRKLRHVRAVETDGQTRRQPSQFSAQ